jgi:hypothetical protein
MPYPAASACLLEGLRDIAGIAVRTDDLRAAAMVTNERIDALIANSDEHRAMVDQLERQGDAEPTSRLSMTNLPTGDEIADELERFLRGEG